MSLFTFFSKPAESKDVASVRLGSAIEAEKVGAQTLVEINAQGEKLKGVERGLDRIQNNLDSAQRDLDQLEKNNSFGFSDLFSLWDRKSPDSSSSSSSTTNSNPNSSIPTGTGEPEVELTPLKRLGNSLVAKIGPVGRIFKTNGAEDEDGNLEEKKTMGTLKNVAIDTRSSVAEQNERLDGLNAKAEATSIRITNANSRVEKLLNK